MFAKLLKHDTKAVFKYWWLGAAASLLLALLGGFCMKIANVDYTKYEILPILGSIGVSLTRLGIYLLPLFSTILLVVRYYKHFFTDEGYLTFTLPVRKNTLLDSKVATGFVFSVLSTCVCLLSLYIIILIGEPEVIGTEEFYYEYSSIGHSIMMICFGYDYNLRFLQALGSYAVPYVILIVLIAIASIIVQLLFIYGCITLASSIVKKHKVLTAIGIYYGASSVVAVVLAVLSVLGLFSSYTTFSMSYVSEPAYDFRMTLLLLTGVFGCMLVVIGALYLLLTFLLDKKLNLE